MALPRDRPLRSELGSFAHLGGTMVFCVVLGLLGGYWADRWLGTTPWLLLVGLAFGIAAAVMNVYRAIKAIGSMDGDGNGT